MACNEDCFETKEDADGCGCAPRGGVCTWSGAALGDCVLSVPGLLGSGLRFTGARCGGARLASTSGAAAIGLGLAAGFSGLGLLS